MSIVVLDGFTMNPGDLSWERFARLGEYTVYDRTLPEETLQRAKGAKIVLTNKTLLDRAVLAELPELEYIGVLATGYNVVDLEAANRQGIVVTNVPSYSTASVAQMAFAHILNLTNRVGLHADSVRDGDWAAAEDFCYWKTPQVELDSLKIGIVGFGQTGQMTARLARAFGMSVLVASRSRPESLPDGMTWVELDELFRQADLVSLHVPLTAETERMVDRDRLATMKPTAMLINTGRGGLVDEAALAEALNEGRLAGAGLDVLSSEPPAANNPLLTARNCFVTPHIAWATGAARGRLMQVAIDNIRVFLDGSPQNVVNR
jgi:glycerate dehydrogenase